MSGDEKPVSRSAKTLAIALALLPPARMAWIVFTNGENNLSNDYLFRVPLVVSMLDGTCSLARYVREAWIGGGHSTIALMPIYYLNARLFEWSVWVELGLGLALAAATLAILMGAVPRSARWLLLPLMSLLLFSTSRVSVFTFGEPALQYGLSQLGVAIGAFALARRPERPIALALALAFGGILASWSWGGGIMTWPVFAVALFLLRVRSFGAWAIFLSGAIAGVAQYVWILFFRTPDPTARGLAPSLKIRVFLDLLGRPFVNGIAHADPNFPSQAAGIGGLLALAAILILFRTSLRARPAPIVLVAWGLLTALEIALFRTGVAPWYASPMALFWAGLLMLLIAAPAPFRAGGIVVVAFLTLSVQRTWEDKSFYLPSRAPVSASCLREWRTAPPGCHARVFQWGDEGRLGELALLGDALERHQLSVFGPRRTYLLQGDVPLGRVRLEPGSALSFFSADGRTPGDIADFRRLDLVLSPGAAVSWRVDLPPNVKSARFQTRVRAAAGDTVLGRGGRVTVDGKTSEARALLTAEARESLSLDLRAYAGSTVTLKIHAEDASGGVLLIFEAPRVLLTLGPGQYRPTR